MKISVTGITHDDNRVKGTASVGHDCLIALITICSIPVSVEYIEGKPLEQYEAELKEKALGIIRAIYTDLDCDGKADDERKITLSGKVTSQYTITLNESGNIASSKVHGVTIEKRPNNEARSTVNIYMAKLKLIGGIDGDVKSILDWAANLKSASQLPEHLQQP